MNKIDLFLEILNENKYDYYIDKDYITIFLKNNKLKTSFFHISAIKDCENLYELFECFVLNVDTK